ncbi:DUF1737 domain-containing protein [Hymenobacter fodinae]|uniref:DUF1737 domain-containing protein n=1 Tax=Hymenobacter fodinae TaxID=2510796 RepID=A0A4Z0P1J4_9BACT|nr:DUF1737 domain-containing protein [Hymenobacter fodinae]
MKKYEVVSGTDLERLKAEVTRQLNNGWKLHGGISVSVDYPAVYYAQALYKETTNA